ncbi:hypothetical protein [Mesorhizobium sp.]|uniref:hypothetical protein n=1 Tax=Mesorhizobium sp. TaxID=1871066 RepID=UPI000FE30DB6|nr:hypothetical protein [Mesorhizobium sp.]RWN51507.1 MAG: hypothetical protein EOR98_26230 [Mesorhizobium sp.]RWN72172.1 MAG: hypothetical protein EOS02_28160 [Mesorhizobium sp.]RWN73393.1 MAG: hypothetical protein EOS01_26305 [Mesorhizobium sp.]RWN85704.1 MAG: hypothetical protein EOS04_21600 [Mesorhizobium sp.]RWO09434.1 MAG: hypothetical protein EOS15_27135 [Mesorhizobium sp.]
MKRLAVFLGLLGFGMFAPTASFASGPAACLTKNDDGGLPESGGEILSEKSEFYNSTETYPVLSFSDMAPTGNNAEFCLRYEVENVGSHDIQNVYWQLAGIRMDRFPPGSANRQSRTRTVLSINKPEPRSTELNAFTNEKITPKVWMTEATVAQAEPSAYALLTTMPLDRLEPSLAAFLQQQGLASGPASAVNVSASNSNVYPIREEISGAGFNLTVSSVARREGDNVRFETAVALSGDAAPSASISIPALEALADAKAANSVDYYASFVSSFREKSKEPIGDFSSRDFTREMPLGGLYDGSIFLVNHPIMVRSNDVTYCYRVKSYSPFAVDFGLNSCPM